MKGTKPILEHVLIEEGWNMPCIICKDGTVYAMIKQGKYMSRAEFEAEAEELLDRNDVFYTMRVCIFDKLEAYRDNKYAIKT